MSNQFHAKGLLTLLAAVILLSACSSAARVLPAGKFSIRIGGGWSGYSMSDINDKYIDEFMVDALGGAMWLEHFSNGPHFSGEIDYALNSRLVLGVGTNYLLAKSEGGTNFAEIEGDFSEIEDDIAGDRRIFMLPSTTEYSVSLIAPEVKGMYQLSLFFGHPYVGGGIAWCFGKMLLKSESTTGSFEREFTAGGIGIEIFGGTAFNLNSIMTLGVEFGYRYFNTGDLTGDNVDLTGLHALGLEFSGPFAGLVTNFKL